MRTLKSEVLHQNPWWEYRHDEYELPDGSVGHYFYGKTRGVSMVIPVLPNGQILLVRQFRYLTQKKSWEFPAGGRKPDQIPEETARVELSEETGYGADTLTLLGKLQPANGFIDDEFSVFMASITQAQLAHPDETEEIDACQAFSVTEIDQMIARGEIWCGETVAAWCLAKVKGLLPA